MMCHSHIRDHKFTRLHSHRIRGHGRCKVGKLASQAPYFICLFILARALVNSLKHVVHLNNVFQNSFPTSRRTQSPLQRPIDYCCLGRQSLFFSENSMKHINTVLPNEVFFDVKIGGIYSNNCSLKA
jgi:hypothetical protein